jgi:hypothetical protein
MTLKEKAQSLLDDFLTGLRMLEAQLEGAIKDADNEKQKWIDAQIDMAQKEKEMVALYNRKIEETQKAKGEHELSRQNLDNEIKIEMQKNSNIDVIKKQQQDYLDGIKGDKKHTEDVLKAAEKLKADYTDKLNALKLDEDRLSAKNAELNDRESKCRNREMENLRKESVLNDKEKDLEIRDLNIKRDENNIAIEKRKLANAENRV